MDKLVKKEVVTLYVSQAALILLAVVCAALPLFVEFASFTGTKAVAALLVLACIAGLNMFFVTKRFYGLHGRLPVRFAYGSMMAVYFKIDENCEKGYFSRDETDRCKKRFCTTFDWLAILDRFSLPLAVFDCAGMVLLIALVILEQVLRHEVRFFTIYGVAGFLVVMQTAWLYIFSRYMFNAVQAWIERLLSEPKNVDARHKNATKPQRSNKDNPLTI